MTYRHGCRGYPDDVRIGACADYLLGKPSKEIQRKWGVTHVTVLRWIAATGHFKLRNKERSTDKLRYQHIVPKIVVPKGIVPKLIKPKRLGQIPSTTEHVLDGSQDT